MMDYQFDEKEFKCYSDEDEYDFSEEIDCGMDFSFEEMNNNYDEKKNNCYEKNNNRNEEKNNNNEKKICITKIVEEAYKAGFEKGKAKGIKKGCKVGHEMAVKQLLKFMKKNRCCIRCRKCRCK